MVLQCVWHPHRYWYVVKILVTPDVREPMLSFAWLSEIQVCWDFTRNALYMHGRFIPLRRKKSPQACRRVYLCQDVVVPPRTQVNVPASSTLGVITASQLRQVLGRIHVVLQCFWHPHRYWYVPTTASCDRAIRFVLH